MNNRLPRQHQSEEGARFRVSTESNPAAPRLFRKAKIRPLPALLQGGDSWSIRNEQNKEILAGSKERMLKALEAHQAEVESRRQVAEAESRAAFENLIIRCPGKDAWI